MSELLAKLLDYVPSTYGQTVADTACMTAIKNGDMTFISEIFPYIQSIETMLITAMQYDKLEIYRMILDQSPSLFSKKDEFTIKMKSIAGHLLRVPTDNVEFIAYFQHISGYDSGDILKIAIEHNNFNIVRYLTIQEKEPIWESEKLVKYELNNRQIQWLLKILQPTRDQIFDLGVKLDTSVIIRYIHHQHDIPYEELLPLIPSSATNIINFITHELDDTPDPPIPFIDPRYPRAVDWGNTMSVRRYRTWIAMHGRSEPVSHEKIGIYHISDSESDSESEPESDPESDPESGVIRYILSDSESDDGDFPDPETSSSDDVPIDQRHILFGEPTIDIRPGMSDEDIFAMIGRPPPDLDVRILEEIKKGCRDAGYTGIDLLP